MRWLILVSVAAGLGWFLFFGHPGPGPHSWMNQAWNRLEDGFEAVTGTRWLPAETPPAIGRGPEVSATRRSRGDSQRQEAPDLWVEPQTGMEFVRIPGGCFRMGSPAGEAGRDPDEGPVRRVCLSGFWMGRYEVTRGQFRLFVERSGYVSEAERQGYSWVYTGKWERKPGHSWRRAGFFQDRSHPVVNVSFNDALAMARWLSKKDGRRFNLPSEAQWEYACRAGTVASRFWGDRPDEACAYANVADLSAAKKFPAWTVHDCDDGFVFTAPVGHYRPNAFGLYDMLGNVWEWCRDLYDSRAYMRAPTKDPVITRGGRGRVVRGGSWYSRPRFVRCAGRDQLSRSDRRSQDQGFRLVIGD